MLDRFAARAIYAVLATGAMWGIPVFDVQAISPAGSSSWATGISSTGAVVGNYQLPDGSFRAFLWQDGQLTPLDVPAGAVQGMAAAVNGQGQVAGHVIGPNGQPTATIWEASGSMTLSVNGYAMAINDLGDIAGMLIGSDGSGSAYVTRNGAIVNLGQPAGGDWSTVTALTSTGVAAGNAMTASGQFRGFITRPDGSTEILGTLGGSSSYANGLNLFGQAAGHAQTSSGTLQATIWTGGTAHGLGTLGGSNSYGYGINSSGAIVGYSDTLSGPSAAFLYANGVMYNMNDLLGFGEGWHLLEAYGINDTGQVVGKALFNGQETAFLATPQPEMLMSSAFSQAADVPEPGAFLLMGAGLIGIGMLRFRRSRG